jgi:hypothetical protein
MRIGKKHIKGAFTGDLWIKSTDYIIPSIDSYTKLLIQGDSIADATGKTVTANGGAAVSTSQYKFSELGRSIYFDGSGDYLSLADSSDWDFGTGNFTIDFWFRPSVVDQYLRLIGNSEGSSGGTPWNSWHVQYFIDGSVGLYRYGTGGNGSVVSSGSGLFSINTWYHVAFVREGTGTDQIKVYINGTLSGTGTSPDDYTNLVGSLTVGGAAFGQQLTGYMSSVRVSKGIARWTSNFTPDTTIYGGAITYFNIPNLDGNTDEEYRFVIRPMFAGSGSSLGIRFNDDSGSNYGSQNIIGNNTSISATRYTQSGIDLHSAANSVSGESDLIDGILYAKSGYIRTLIVKSLQKITGTTCTAMAVQGHCWNNTSSNITSLQLFASDNCLAAGSSIELWKKVKRI